MNIVCPLVANLGEECFRVSDNGTKRGKNWVGKKNHQMQTDGLKYHVG